MDWKALQDIPPWEWPEDAAEILIEVLRDPRTAESDRLLAAALAGDVTEFNEDLVQIFLSIVKDGDASDELRGRVAISLGPILEEADMDGFDDPDDQAITEPTFHLIQASLAKLYRDAEVPKDVRRMILEASVRAPQDWHPDAIRAAYVSDDEAWKLTAVFCMRFVPGFEKEILAALESENEQIFYEAVCAAGNFEVSAAWRHIAPLLSEGTEKPLLLAAIEAAASIRPDEAEDLLSDFTESDDEDIAEAAAEALVMTNGFLDVDDEEGD